MRKMDFNNLIWKKQDFGKQFMINDEGMIWDFKNNRQANSFWEGKKYYTILYFEGKTYRIQNGLAQVESGLKRTIMDKATGRKSNQVPRLPFNQKQRNYIKELIQDEVEKQLKIIKTP